MKFLLQIGIIISLLATALTPQPGSAAEYPDRPIRVLIPAAPGGITDIPGRIIMDRMRESLGQSMIIENRGGAGGTIAAVSAKGEKPDGYSLFYSHAAVLTSLPALMPKIAYSIKEDFVPIVLAVRVPFALVVRGDSPFRTLKDLLEAARSRPKGLNYATAGIGNFSHLIGMMLSTEARATMVPIHYRGDGPAIQDLIGGQVDFFMAGAVRPQVDSGQLRVLAVTGTKRWYVFPDAPTFDELGVHNVELYGFSGFLAPKGTPAAIVARINKAANDALADPRVRERLMGFGFEVMGGSPEFFGNFIASEMERIGGVGRANNLVLE